jgi:hypothetical protein
MSTNTYQLSEIPQVLKFVRPETKPNTSLTKEVFEKSKISVNSWKRVPYSAEDHARNVGLVLDNVIFLYGVLDKFHDHTGCDYWINLAKKSLAILDRAEQYFTENQVYIWDTCLDLIKIRREQLLWILAEFERLEKIQVQVKNPQPFC